MSVSHCLGSAAAKLARLPVAERDALIAALPAECPRADCTTGAGCRDYVAGLFGSAADTRRRECEARHWLRSGYRTRAKVEQLMNAITDRRGAEQAAALREAMREQWKNRAAWLTGEPA